VFLFIFIFIFNSRSQFAHNLHRYTFKNDLTYFRKTSNIIMSSTAFRFVLVLAAACNAVTWATDEVDLGTAGNYVMLTKTGISTVPTSIITGDIAVSPIAAAAMTGFDLANHPTGTYWTSPQVTGRAFGADGATPTPTILTTAIGDMELAYADAFGRVAEGNKINLGAGTLGGDGFGDEDNKLEPGVYTFTIDLTIGSDLFFEGGVDDVFILRTAGTLMQVANTNVILSGGALAKNIFWQVTGKVVIHAGAHMEGILLVKTDILFETGSSLLGRAMSQTACNIQKATMTEPPSGTDDAEAPSASMAPSAAPSAATTNLRG
jgi:hypothetical protein